MLKNQNDEKVYFVESTGKSATRIGTAWISPGQTPVGFTEAQYNARRKEIEHYVKAGVVMLHSPGTKESAQAAIDVKLERERLSTVMAGRKEPPPAPTQMPTPAPPEPARITTFSAPSEDDEPDTMKCIVNTSKGERCKVNALGKLLVCGVHQRSLLKGSELYDTAGNRIAQDGKSFTKA